jgi:hypothetical protein
VGRETPAGDRRAVRVVITDAGRVAADTAGRGFRTVLDEVLGFCADPEAVLIAIDQLRAALDARWEARVSGRSVHAQSGQDPLAPTLSKP